MRKILFWFLLILIVLGVGRHGFLPVAKVLNWLTPLERASYQLAYQSWQGLNLLWTLPLLFRENRNLKLKVADLEYLKIENENLKRENEALRGQLEAPVGHSLKLLPARLLGGQTFGDNFLLLIDQGLDNGVEKGMAVVFQKILIGQVSQASSHQSLVLSTFSNESKIPAKIVNVGKGMVVGEFNSRLRLVEIPLEAAVAPGQLVVSSGDGGTYPADLLIGQIIKVSRRENQIFQEAILNLPWDLKDLETVFVMLQ